MTIILEVQTALILIVGVGARGVIVLVVVMQNKR